MKSIGISAGLGILFVIQTAALLYIASTKGPPFMMLLIAAVPLALALPKALIQAHVRLREVGRTFRWWHLAWLSASVGSMSFRSRNVNDIYDSPVDVWAAFRIATVILVVFLITAKIDFVASLRSTSRGVPGMVLWLVLLSLASSLWSVYPSWTAYKSFEVLCDILLVGAILYQTSVAASLKTLFDWTWVILAGSLGCVWAGVILWPSEALIPGVGVIGRQLCGVVPSLSANGVGDLAAVLSLVALNRILATQKRHGGLHMYSFFLVLALITLVLAQTRSALAAFLVATVVVMLCWRRFALAITVVGSALAAFSIAAVAEGARAFIMRDQSTELFLSLTGRVVWWEAAWQAIVERPWLGYGAYTGRFAVAAALGGEVPTIHNTYLDILLGLGVLGLILLLLVIVRFWAALLPAVFRVTADCDLRLIVIESLGLMTMMTVRSFLTSNMLWHGALDFLLIVASSEFVRRSLVRQSSHASLRVRTAPLQSTLTRGVP